MAAAAGLAIFSFDESDLDDAVESYNLVKARNVRPDSERPFYVKGIVRKRYPVFKTAKGNQMKVLISDGENHYIKLIVFFRGDYCDFVSEKLEEKDHVLLFDPKVSMCPRGLPPDQHSFQLIMEEVIDTRKLFVTKVRKRSKSVAFEPDESLVAMAAAAPKEPSPKNLEKNTKEIYTRLRNLEAGKMYNVYGVVTFFKPPRQTRGEGMCSFVKIIDSSDSMGLKCSLYHKDERMLPHVYRIGDIIRIHRLKMGIFEGELQGSYGPGGSSIVVDGRLGEPIRPRTGSLTYTFDKSDEDNIQKLRLWASINFDDSPVYERVTIDSVRPGNYFDLLCQVIGSCPTKAGNCTVLRVLDGTKRKISCKCADVPLQKFDVNLLSYATSNQVSIDVFCYDDHASTAMEIQPGSYVVLHNCHALPYRGLVSGEEDKVEICLHKGSSHGRGITVVTVDDHGSKELKKVERKIRDALKENYTPSAIRTRLEGDELKQLDLSSIRDISQDLEVPKIYRVVASVVSYSPRNAQNMIQTLCLSCGRLLDSGAKTCAFCQHAKSQRLELIYAFKLTLRDATGDLNVILFKEDALAFLDDFLPELVFSSSDRATQLRAKLDSLLIRKSSNSSPPLLEFVLKSYRHSRTDETMYRVTATRLVEDE